MMANVKKKRPNRYLVSSKIVILASLQIQLAKNYISQVSFSNSKFFLANDLSKYAKFLKGLLVNISRLQQHLFMVEDDMCHTLEYRYTFSMYLPIYIPRLQQHLFTYATYLPQHTQAATAVFFFVGMPYNWSFYHPQSH